MDEKKALVSFIPQTPLIPVQIAEIPALRVF
jgi:hypothetical protein